MKVRLRRLKMIMTTRIFITCDLEETLFLCDKLKNRVLELKKLSDSGY